MKQRRLAKVRVIGTHRNWWWLLDGGNGECMFHSETFTRRADARRAMRRAIQIIQSGLFRIEE